MNGALPEWITFTFLAAVAWGLSALLIAFRWLSQGRGSLGFGLRLVLFVWLGLPALLAAKGLLSEFDAVPPMLMRVIAPIAILVTVFAFSRFGRIAAYELPVTLLVGFQAFRVPVEVVLHALYQHELVPQAMTFAGYNFDIVTGITAALLWLMLRTREVPRWLVLAWNTLGLALLVTIVTIAILSFPKPFGWFTPENRIVAYFPWVWLPTFLVPLALFGHLLVFRRCFGPDEHPADAGSAPSDDSTESGAA